MVETAKKIELRYVTMLRAKGAKHAHVIVRDDPLTGERTVRFRDKLTTRMTELTPAAAEALYAKVAHVAHKPFGSTDELLDLVDAVPEARKLAPHPLRAKRAKLPQP